MSLVKRLLIAIYDYTLRLFLLSNSAISIRAKIINPRKIKVGDNTSVSFGCVLWADGKEITCISPGADGGACNLYLVIIPRGFGCGNGPGKRAISICAN